MGCMDNIQVWKELGRKRVFDSFRKIDAVEYRLPNGLEKSFDIVIETPSICTLALTPDREVILTEQFRPGPNKIFLELPGGMLDSGEEPLAGAARELLEETGYEGKVEFVADCWDDAYSIRLRSCFVVTGCHKVRDQELESSEFVRDCACVD
ncbi:MAG: ADP-ribose pyrophosphatase [Patescibacteria group bacterium]|nr:ADP-ribose pyrophosphatase [Patescibacteria group bacterium]